MSGLVGLVPLAELLAGTVGSRQGAVRLAAQIFDRGAAALPRGSDNVIYAARRQLVAAGVVTDSGVPVSHRAAELVVVCEVLAASTLPSCAPPPQPRLVLSAPAGTAPIADVERLDGLVLDVIRRATDTLHVGGAFWNDQGFELLEELLLPALTVRSVTAVIYANSPAEERFRGPLEERLDRLVGTGRVVLRWFSGPRPTMLHAKFVIADRGLGYLGTANLTSWGLQGHIEAGVELTVGQAERFVVFLEQLEAAGLFVSVPPV
ncbi:phospholipase D-like domain-containing protein [Mycolicibacter algericus]|uniref:phospholipase D-like domain-containing protein n=1 Tax=Mycolicibacter algericus TaxID=1288388 RepID=UPI0013D6C866|nr:phospholipase D-like domain-containing protein [Mycolicibacter algericus]